MEDLKTGKIRELEEVIKDMSSKAEDIEESIESMHLELNHINNTKDSAKRQIEEILKERKKEEKIQKRIKEIGESSGFERALKKASLFCSMDRWNKSLSVISIYEDKIVAMNGYFGIIINIDIPKDRQDTNVDWDLEEMEHSGKTTSIELMNKAIDFTKENYNRKVSMKKEELFNELNPEERSLGENSAYVFLYDDIELAIDTKFFDIAMSVVGKNDIVSIMFPDSRLKGLVMEVSNQIILLMPIRLSEEGK